MKQIDRLYMWSLILTVGAASLMFTGMLLPNWWVQTGRKGITTRIFGLYGNIHCGANVCYPTDQLPITVLGVPVQYGSKSTESTPTTNPPGSSGSTITTDPVEGNGSTSDPESSSVSDSTTLQDNTGSTAGNDSTEEFSNSTTSESSTSPKSTSVSATTTTSPISLQPISVEHPANAGWLVGGRVMGGIGMALVMITLLLQMAFMLFPHYRFEYVSLGFLVAAALISFITGFIFISKFSALSRVYATERPPGALSYTSAAPGCILICSLLCVVAAVFTMMALHPAGGSTPKTTKSSQRKTTASAPGTEPNETGVEGDAETLLA